MPTPTIAVLDPTETSKALAGNRFGSSAVLNEVALQLMEVVDSDYSVYVAGLNESSLNALRTKMQRRNIRVTVRKITRDGEVGHVLVGKTIK